MVTVNVIGVFQGMTELTTLYVPIPIPMEQDEEHKATFLAHERAARYFPQLGEKQNLGKYLGHVSDLCKAGEHTHKLVEKFLSGNMGPMEQSERRLIASEARAHILTCPIHQLMAQIVGKSASPPPTPLRIENRSMTYKEVKAVAGIR